jgi:hypothetical protein
MIMTKLQDFNKKALIESNSQKKAQIKLDSNHPTGELRFKDCFKFDNKLMIISVDNMTSVCNIINSRWNYIGNLSE